jgi:hypothetical protein
MEMGWEDEEEEGEDGGMKTNEKFWLLEWEEKWPGMLMDLMEQSNVLLYTVYYFKV